MPTYNQERFIGKAIATVVTQTYKNWELIVVNNFSTDKTKEVVASFQDPRIRLIDFANNGIIAASRNHAMQKSSGEVIAFLDSDDYWLPEKLQKSLDKLREGFDLICHGEFYFQDHNGEFSPHKYGPEAHCTFEHMLLNGNCLSTSAIMVKRSVLDQSGLFDECKPFNTAEDFDLWLRIAELGAKIGITDEMLGYYRLHSGSASASNLKNAKATLAVLEARAQKAALSAKVRVMAFFRRTRVWFFIVRLSMKQRL